MLLTPVGSPYPGRAPATRAAQARGRPRPADHARPPSHLGKPQVPNLYGGYLHPGSAGPSSLTLIVSQWPGVVHEPPYWVRQFDGINP
ncbi:hypothetical protein [Kitasatospora sp. NPDC091207]|uniref:hypothetical protein n=1 Tax=Kitasatospora sp. NPDC091207 TaxID=3364083 RepID=UPI0037F99191